MRSSPTAHQQDRLKGTKECAGGPPLVAEYVSGAVHFSRSETP
jgi:hypothetical protein